MAELQSAELVQPPHDQMDVEAGRDQNSSADEDRAQHADCEDGNIFGDFLFTKTDQNVAVYYDDDFHIGSVGSICTPELAEVNFRKKCAAVNNTYVRPLKADQAAVQCLFVFDCDFDIVTITGRVWSGPSHDVLNLKYAVYKQKYLEFSAPEKC